MTSPVTLSFHARHAIITINNPSKLGALTKDGFYLISKYLREIELHDEIFITILTGTGRFFSAGADVSVNRETPSGQDPWRHGLQITASSNLNMTQAFYSHSKILVVALNGPVVGLAAALCSFADFIYCTPSTYLLTPFSSLGLVAEGGSSLGFVRRMGITKANEALIMSKRIPADELLVCGYVNKIIEGDFLNQVLKEVDDRLGSHLIGSSLIKIKELIAAPMRREIDAMLVKELFFGLERTAAGIPQWEFAKIKRGEKRHKL
ncbi:hypothetical protein MBLNU457_7554t1 [Dothideomycetes sp. NU457]